MFWRKRKNREERLPWYRRRDYKGNLTEDEKRELDHFRRLAQQPGGKHPADHDLPEEVNLYISKLKIELHDARGTLLMGQVLFLTAIGALLLWCVFFGWRPLSLVDSTWMFLLGVFNIVFAWFYYFREQKKLGDQLMDDEGIMVEWELKHLASRRRKPDHYDYE